MDPGETPPEPDGSGTAEPDAGQPGDSWNADTGDGPPTSDGDVPYVEHYIETVPVAPVPRRWPTIAAMLLLVPGAVVLALVLVSTTQERDDWKARALEAEGKTDDLRSHLSVASADAESLEDLVPSLRDDMEATEDRLATTAEELDAARSQSGAATLIAVLAADAADKSRLCLERSDELLDGILRAYERNTTLKHLVPLSNDVETLCAVADESYAAFSQAANDRSETQVAGIQQPDRG